MPSPWQVNLHKHEGRVHWNRYWGGLLRRASQYTRDQPTPESLEFLCRRANSKARIRWNNRTKFYELVVLREIPFFIGPVDECDDGLIQKTFTIEYPLGPFKADDGGPIYPTEEWRESCEKLLRMCQSEFDKWQAEMEAATKAGDQQEIQALFIKNEERTMRAVQHDKAKFRLGEGFVNTEGTGPNQGGHHFGDVFERTGT